MPTPAPNPMFVRSARHARRAAGDQPRSHSLHGNDSGLALHSAILEFSKFDRKNYFSPDMRRDTRYRNMIYPWPSAEYLDIDTEAGPKRMGITRVHLEEDTGKSAHPGGGFSLVDFNRCGVPLMEIVQRARTMAAPEEARIFCAFAQLLLYLGISNGDMSKGCFRCDANVSVRPVGSPLLARSQKSRT